MADILSTLSSVIKLAQELSDIAKKIRDAKVANLVADLNLQLADLKLEVAQLKEENLSLQGQLRSMHQAEDLRSKLVARENVYFFAEPIEGRPVGPYCPTCFDVHNKLVLLAELPSVFHDMAKYKCNNCKGHF